MRTGPNMHIAEFILGIVITKRGIKMINILIYLIRYLFNLAWSTEKSPELLPP